MTSKAREFIKRHIPASARKLVFGLRDALGQPPIDEAVLAHYRFDPDASERPRLSLVIDNLTPASTFGGVVTGIDIFLRLAKEAGPELQDLRLILTNPTSDSDSAIMLERAARLGFDPANVEVVQVTTADEKITVRARDMFVTYNWWTTLNTSELVKAQAAHFGQPIKPLIYLIQEYEPHMIVFSAAQILAREAYDTPERLWGVVNSSNLHRYFEIQGHQIERAFVFEPVINDKLRPHLDSVVSSAREKRILVYGRPSIARNCFPALVRGLRRWAAQFPGSEEWSVISAGMAHKPIPLGNGKAITSVGKLSLDGYAEMLLGSSVGVSLMASPHPSYPPLEMAHMGLRVVTNSYLCKDLSSFHPGIVSTDSIAEEALADAIAKACRDAGEPPSGHRNESYVREELYPFMGELAEAVRGELGL